MSKRGMLIFYEIRKYRRHISSVVTLKAIKVLTKTIAPFSITLEQVLARNYLAVLLQNFPWLKATNTSLFECNVDAPWPLRTWSSTSWSWLTPCYKFSSLRRWTSCPKSKFFRLFLLHNLDQAWTGSSMGANPCRDFWVKWFSSKLIVKGRRNESRYERWYISEFYRPFSSFSSFHAQQVRQ